MDKILDVIKFNVSDKIRWNIVNIIVVLLVFMTWISKANDMLNSRSIYIISFVLYVCLILILNEGKFSYIKTNLLIKLYFLYSGVFILGSILSHRIGSLLIGIIYIIIFPLISYVLFDKSKIKKFLDSFFNAIIINFVVIFICSVILINAGKLNQYGGIVNNANSFSLLALIGLIAAIYKNHENKSSYIWSVMIGVCLGSILVAQSRTVLICISVNLIIWIIYSIINKNICIKIKKIIIIIILAIVSSISLLFFHQAVVWLLGIDTGGIIDPFKVRIAHGFDGYGTITTGRYEIWTSYLSDLNIFPHNDSEMPLIGGEAIEFSAHNTYLHIGYCFGLLCGVMYLIYNIFVGIKSLKMIVKKRNDFTSIMVFIIILNYGIVTLVETLYDPIVNTLCLSYWVISSLLVFKMNSQR